MSGDVARLSSLEDNLVTSLGVESSTNGGEKDVKDSVKEEDNSKKRGIEEVQEGGGKTEGKAEPSNESNKKSKVETKCGQNLDQKDSSQKEADEIPLNERMEQIKQKLDSIIGDKSAASVIELLQKWEKEKELHMVKVADEETKQKLKFPPPKGVDDETKFFTLPLIEDKQRRKDIHLLIKSDLVNPIAMADTLDKKIRVWHKMFEKQMPNYKKFGTQHDNRDKQSARKRESWPKDRPDFLKFVLYKENIDTTTAIKDIQRIARVNPRGPKHHRGVSGGVTYAGMKDKRGVTTQFCTVFRKSPKDLLVMNGTNQNNRKGGGNTNNKGTGILRLGSFSYVNKELKLGLLNGNRFDIVLRNVCIEQSDKSTKRDIIEATTKRLRECANAMKDIGFINYFGMQRFGKFHDTHLVGIAVLKGDFKTACDLIMRVKPGEQERYKVLREKWQNRFNGVDMSNDDEVDKAEMECAKELLRGLGRFMNCETSIMHSLSRKPRDYKKAFGTIAKHMRSMFLHAYQSILWNKAASHRIEKGGAKEVMEGDLVLLDKNSEGRSSGLKGKQVHVVTQDDVETGKFSVSDFVLPLVGTRVELPTNCTADLFETLLEEDGLTFESFKNIQDRELALCGDYRKVICKPDDVDFEIKLYKDPLQPLIKTDLMTIHGDELECVDLTCNDQNVEDFNGGVDEKKVAMVIGFTLPPSAYATIALRELMKRPTSAEYQTELKLEGECEGNLRKKD